MAKNRIAEPEYGVLPPAYKYGKSTSMIARRSGMSVAAVCRALGGRGTGLVNAKRMADAMGITLDEFWERHYAHGKSRVPLKMGLMHIDSDDGEAA